MPLKMRVILIHFITVTSNELSNQHAIDLSLGFDPQALSDNKRSNDQ